MGQIAGPGEIFPKSADHDLQDGVAEHRLRAAGQILDDGDEWKKEGDDDRSNDEGEENDHDGFKEGGEAGDCVIHLLFKNVGNFG